MPNEQSPSNNEGDRSFFYFGYYACKLFQKALQVGDKAFKAIARGSTQDGTDKDYLRQWHAQHSAAAETSRGNPQHSFNEDHPNWNILVRLQQVETGQDFVQLTTEYPDKPEK